MSDQTRARFHAVVHAVMETKGDSAPADRRAFADYVGEVTHSYPQPLRDLGDALRAKPTQADIEGLLAEGRSEDELFELVLAGCTGAGRTRLEAGLAALDEVFGADS